MKSKPSYTINREYYGWLESQFPSGQFSQKMNALLCTKNGEKKNQKSIFSKIVLNHFIDNRCDGSRENYHI